MLESIRAICQNSYDTTQINTGAVRPHAEKPRCILGGKVAVLWMSAIVSSKFENIIITLFLTVNFHWQMWNNVDPQRLKLNSGGGCRLAFVAQQVGDLGVMAMVDKSCQHTVQDIDVKPPYIFPSQKDTHCLACDPACFGHKTNGWNRFTLPNRFFRFFYLQLLKVFRYNNFDSHWHPLCEIIGFTLRNLSIDIIPAIGYNTIVRELPKDYRIRLAPRLGKVNNLRYHIIYGFESPPRYAIP